LSAPRRTQSKRQSGRSRSDPVAKRRTKVHRATKGGNFALRRALGSLGVTLVGALLALFFWSVSARPVRKSEAWFAIEVAGDVSAVLRDLYHQGLIDSPELMQLYLRVLVPWTDIRPGSHLLKQGLTARELVQRLSANPSRPIQKLTIVEGWNRWEIADRLHDSGVVAREPFLAAMRDASFLSELGIAGDSAEGYLFPATYPFQPDTAPKDLIRRLVKQTRKRLQRVTQKHGPAATPQGLSERELLILASIVEKETARAAERPRIARVFLNRLAHPEAETLGRLQSDPTALYGCHLEPEAAASCQGESTRVTPRMLGDSANRYNTYRHAGLPPGPIGNPGSAAIEAVLFPAGGDEYFFVADGQGGHQFSVTFEEHREAVRKLREKRSTSVTSP